MNMGLMMQRARINHRPSATGEVVALLHFDGTNGSAVFTDEIGNVWSRVFGSATISTVRSRFGTASLLNTRPGGIQTPSSATFALGAKDFTLEAWVMQTASISGFAGLFGKRPSSATNASFVLGTAASNTVWMFQWSTTGTDGPVVQWTTPNINGDGLFHHVALCRHASELVLYFDGVPCVPQGQNTISDIINNSSAPLTIGLMSSSSGIDTTNSSWPGYIDEARIIIGAARYSGPFAPSNTPFSIGD